MSTYRIRVKWDEDPTQIWRDVELGSERTLGHLASVFTPDVGLLDTSHLWFFGVDGKYWNSPVKYLHSQDYQQTKAEQNASGPLRSLRDAEIHNAHETTFDELGLDEGDRLTYLFDYGDEWRFYLIVKEINPNGPFDRNPEIVKRKGGYLNQYMRSPDEPLVYSEEEWKEHMGSSVDNSSDPEENDTPDPDESPLDLEELIEQAMESDSPDEFVDRTEYTQLPKSLIARHPDPDQQDNHFRSLMKAFWLHLPRPEHGLRAPIETKQYSHVGLSREDYEDVGRNDPCPCGSGNKYKYCCMEKSNPESTSPEVETGAEFHADLMGTHVLEQLSEEELEELARHEEPARKKDIVEELMTREMFEPALRLLKSIVPIRSTYTQEDWYELSCLFDLVLETEGEQVFEHVVISYLEETKSPVYLTFSFLLGLSRNLLRNPERGKFQVDHLGPETEFLNHLIDITYQLHNERSEEAVKTVSDAMSYWNEYALVDDIQDRDEGYIQGATFGTQFLSACLQHPGLTSFYLTSEFNPDTFTNEVLTTTTLVGSVISFPDDSPLEVETFDDHQLAFTDTSSVSQWNLPPVEESGDEDPFEELVEQIRETPSDLGLLIELTHVLMERGFHEQAYQIVQRGVQLGRQALPNDYKPGVHRMEWADHANRPFMKLLELKMDLEGHHRDNPHDALDLAQELLDLNPGDNQGIRESAVGFALWTGETDLALRICEDYPDDTLPGIMYGRALALFWQGDEVRAHQALEEAIEQLPNVAKQLVNPGNFESITEEAEMPGVVHGGETEALLYVLRWRPAWEQYGGAMEWLESRVRRTVGV